MSQDRTAQRPAELLLAVCGVLLVLALGLGGFVVHLLRAKPGLEALSAEERIRLVGEARRIAPSVFETVPGLESPGFYRLVPSSRYDRSHPAAGPKGVFGDEFTTNELGFRAIPAAKPSGVRRIVVVGDSWTFGPGVSHEETFGQRLAAFLNEEAEGPPFEVYNLAMMGWNTENEIAALRLFLGWLDPDFVVFCPTSNDIDDAYGVWNGTLVQGAFQAGGLFRRSYEVERRWGEVLRRLDQESHWLVERGIPVLIYFLAEWRSLAPYYAEQARLQTPYAVVPEAFIVAPYRLAPEEDAGQHANAEGHRRIAGSLHDAIVAMGWTSGTAREPDFPARLSQPKDAAAVEAEFSLWRRNVDLRGAIDREQGLLGRETVLVAPNGSGAARVRLGFELLDAPSLYPLRVEARLLASVRAEANVTFERYRPGVQWLELERPAELALYDFVELRLVADRVVSTAGLPRPVSLRFADLRVE